MINATRAFTEFPAAPYAGSLVIFTPFYEGRAFAGYTHSLALSAMVLDRLGIKWDYWCSSGDFHVERALNKALTNFAESDHTDFVCIDSDEAWNPDGLLRLLSHDKEMVGAAYRKKNRWSQWTAAIKLEANGVPAGEMTATGPLIRAERLPGGFLRFTKPALAKFREAYPDDWYWDTEDTTPGVEPLKVKVAQYFTTSLRDHEFFSQDFNFCERIKAAGVELWLEPNITIGHHGLTEYIGNLDQELRGEHAKQQAHAQEQAAAMANIEAFAKKAKATCQ